MARTTGWLVVLAFVAILVGGAVPATDARADDAAWAATPPAGGDAVANDEKEREKPKSGISRDYADRLKGKTRKAPKAPPKKPKYKPWNKVLKDAESIEGMISMHYKDEKLYFELREDQMDKPFLAILNLSQGIGSHFIFGGLPVDDIMFDFHRNKDHVQIRRLSTMFRAPGDEQLQKTIDLTFSESIIGNLPIVSEKDDGKTVLIEMNKFLLSDISAMSIWMGQMFRQPVRLDPKAGYYEELKNYPTNTEIDTRLTYSPSRVIRLNIPNVPDPRRIQVGVQFSIRMLPEDPIVPRIADDRVGYFTTTHKDFRRAGEENFFVHYANRWRLEKKDPDAAVSEVVNPIVFYLDHTIPEKYVPHMKRGVEMWQRAFEAAGLKNAIIAKRAPSPEEDPEYDPEDARYNTIRWNVSDSPLYGAIGPSRVDPRTGEILDSDILFEHSIVTRFNTQFARYAKPQTALMSVDPYLREIWADEVESDVPDITDIPYFKNKPHMFCAINDAMSMETSMQYLALLDRGLIGDDDSMREEYTGDALALVAAHEVGHAIGLRHNFKSSSAVDYETLNDVAAIDETGMTGSVMDYAAANIAPEGQTQGYYFSPTVGTYDRWAVKWGYSPMPGETAEEQSARCEKIARLSTEKKHLYGTDEDTYPGGALDPRAHTRDLSDDPLQWAIDRINLCDRLLVSDRLVDRLVEDGENHVAVNWGVRTLLVQKYAANLKAVKFVGGQYTSRAHKGDPGGQLPLEPVAVSEQRKALDFITRNVLDTEDWLLDADLLNRIQDNKMRSWQNSIFAPGRRFDFPLSQWVLAIQTGILRNLMNPMLQARVVDCAYKVDDPFKLSEVYSTLTRTIWTNNTIPGGKTAGMHRNLQRVYVRGLVEQVLQPSPMLPQDAIALSRLNLRRVRNAANTALQRSGLDDETNAHLMETVAQIDRALEAERSAAF